MKMRIFAATFAFICMTGIAFHQAMAQGIPPMPSEKQLLSCIAGSGSYNEAKCDKAKNDLEKHMDAVSDACKEADTFEGKKIWLKDLFSLYVHYNIYLEDERGLSWEEMCGAFLWEQNTWVQAYTDDIVPPRLQTLELNLEVDDQVEVHARIYTSVCKEKDWDTCGEEKELPYSGEWAWGSTDPEVFVVEKEYSRTGLVKAVGGGTATLVVLMPDFEEDPHLLQAGPDVIVGEQDAVDIALVIESANATFDYIGMALWDCAEDACVGWGADTWTDWQGYWGLCGYPGDQIPGRFQVEDPGVLAISLQEDGPFASGPLSITLTCDDNYVAKTDQLWFKALAEGVTKVGYCIGYTCDPLRSVGIQWDKQITVGTAVPRPVDPPGLRQIGAQVASELSAKFENYRFAATAFGAYPEYGVPCSGYNGYEWYLDDFKPLWDTAPYRDFLDFTSSDSTITEALSQVRLICDDPLPVYPPYGGKSVYTAIIHAINDFAWRENAFRTVIVFSVNPACWEYGDTFPYCDTEKVSGYTRQDVTDAALAANVKLIMINAGWGSYKERMRGPFQDAALVTNGWYTEDYLDFWPILTAFEKAFQWVLDEEPRLGKR